MSLLNAAEVRDILRSSRTGMWRVEFGEHIQPRFYADAVMDELLGLPEDLSPQERFIFHRAHIHPDDMELFEEYSDKLSEIRSEVVYRYIHPIQGEMMVRCGGVCVSSTADIVIITGTHQDISDTIRLEKNKFAEMRLAEMNQTLRREQLIQENYYQELLDIQSCGVMAYTLPGHKMIHMNAEALRMYGLKDIEDAQMHLGLVLSRIYYPDAQTCERLKALRKEDDFVDYECILNHGCPGECHIMAKTKVFRIPSGKRAVVTTFLDVSDMVVLRDALKKAEEGSRAKSSFLFAMSHDLRTPMNAIIGYAQLMEAHWGEKELTTGYLQKLKDASQFLLSLIGNILEMARIESGKETLHEEPWNLSQLQNTLDILLDNEISQKHLTIQKTLHLLHPDVICDSMKIREILMNLLSNAVKYTPDNGTITLSVDELPSDQGGFTMLRIIVADSGIGISKEYLPHLFEAFSRERDSSESGIIGSGLGLKIVKSFVDLMHGQIRVDSEPGQGTQFTVTIPLRIARPGDRQALQKQASSDLHTLKGIRVLLAEDNPLNAEITQTILEDAQMQTELATDGASALSMLQNAPAGYYDLILMDIQMPHMNGYQAARAIRALPDERSNIPIIAMTANAFKEDKEAAFAAGMNDYIIKPVDISSLLQKLAKVLSSGI